MSSPRPLSILIVDDNEVDRHLLKRDLARANIEASTFESSNGLKALEFLKDYGSNREKYGDDFPPVLILLDINMPMLDGFGFLESFQGLRAEQQAYQSCVIMMFTSSGNPSDLEQSLEFEFVVDYIVKGKTEPQDLHTKVMAAVG